MEQLHNVKETSKFLNTSLPTIRAWIHQNRLPVVRLGRKVLVKKSVIEKILDAGLEAVDPTNQGRI